MWPEILACLLQAVRSTLWMLRSLGSENSCFPLDFPEARERNQSVWKIGKKLTLGKLEKFIWIQTNFQKMRMIQVLYDTSYYGWIAFSSLRCLEKVCFLCLPTLKLIPTEHRGFVFCIQLKFCFLTSYKIKELLCFVYVNTLLIINKIWK